MAPTWDPLLYAGAAAHYATGRVAYPAELASAVVDALDLDGTGTLVDVGCGPGSLTLLLAPHVAHAIGVDPDPGMLAEGARLATAAGLTGVSWRRLRAEDLPADLPPARLVTFAQSFHWFDRPRVAAAVRTLLTADGVVVHVGATTHRGRDGDDATDPLPHPRPPWDAVTALVRAHLGSDRRAGGRIRSGPTASDEDVVFAAAGFTGPTRLELPDRVVERTVDDVVAAVHSLSFAAPHLFGADLERFDADLRELLTGASDNGLFNERMRGATLSLWR